MAERLSSEQQKIENRKEGWAIQQVAEITGIDINFLNSNGRLGVVNPVNCDTNPLYAIELPFGTEYKKQAIVYYCPSQNSLQDIGYSRDVVPFDTNPETTIFPEKPLTTCLNGDCSGCIHGTILYSSRDRRFYVKP